MATRTNPLHEADHRARRQLAELGRELRIARVTGGRTQSAVARAIGTSQAHVSQLERGRLSAVTYRQLALLGAAVGMNVSVRAFPAGRRLLDAPQLALLADLRARAHPSWRWATEVPIPLPGDFRAVDATAAIPGCVLACELWTRLADWQAQSRAALLKQRDLGADRLVVVLRGSRANRSALGQAGAVAPESFPTGTRSCLEALAAGRDPGGNAIVLI
jgi:transcriptional regulator with XRE-family HTH domain